MTLTNTGFHDVNCIRGKHTRHLHAYQDVNVALGKEKCTQKSIFYYYFLYFTSLDGNVRVGLR